MAGVLTAPLAACGLPAALAPQTPQGEAVAGLIWGFTALCTLIWVLVLAGLAVALWRRRLAPADPLALDMPAERRMGTVVAVLIALTGLIVIALTVLSFAAQRELFGPARDALTIDIVGHQWWWQVVYNSTDPSQTISTANEIHIPVGRPVTLKLTSADVIHSFWVPSLMGKADLIPGRHNELTFTARKAGIYDGSCAEFCGLQHAHMGIRVVAETASDFAAWRQAQLQPAAAPATPSAQQGQAVFQGSACAFCHTVSGTSAGGQAGPDLTHLASRSTLAAGTLPFGRGQLAAWISDPQGIKTGAQMPDLHLAPEQLNALLDYLMGLK
ncbi:MAG TPA: cytochrome c oxidase subunit II [Devosiaceae bacterium]|nr:cytochrome c oxidase subunit II [Devosiaceae bacterium]